MTRTAENIGMDSTASTTGEMEPAEDGGDHECGELVIPDTLMEGLLVSVVSGEAPGEIVSVEILSSTTATTIVRKEFAEDDHYRHDPFGHYSQLYDILTVMGLDIDNTFNVLFESEVVDPHPTDPNPCHNRAVLERGSLRFTEGCYPNGDRWTAAGWTRGSDRPIYCGGWARTGSECGNLVDPVDSFCKQCMAFSVANPR